MPLAQGKGVDAEHQYRPGICVGRSANVHFARASLPQEDRGACRWMTTSWPPLAMSGSLRS